LINEVVSCVAHEADAVQNPPSDELSRDNHGIDRQSDLEPGSEMCVRGERRHEAQFRMGQEMRQALPKVSIKKVAGDYGTDVGGGRSLNTG
jgi:hypothetical protein